MLEHVYYPQWVWHMTPTCLFLCLPWVMYVDTGVLPIHICGISFEVVCLTISQGGVWAGQGKLGLGRGGQGGRGCR